MYFGLWKVRIPDKSVRIMNADWVSMMFFRRWLRALSSSVRRTSSVMSVDIPHSAITRPWLSVIGNLIEWKCLRSLAGPMLSLTSTVSPRSRTKLSVSSNKAPISEPNTSVLVLPMTCSRGKSNVSSHVRFHIEKARSVFFI